MNSFQLWELLLLLLLVRPPPELGLVAFGPYVVLTLCKVFVCSFIDSSPIYGAPSSCQTVLPRSHDEVAALVSVWVQSRERNNTGIWIRKVQCKGLKTVTWDGRTSGWPRIKTARTVTTGSRWSWLLETLLRKCLWVESAWKYVRERTIQWLTKDRSSGLDVIYYQRIITL